MVKQLHGSALKLWDGLITVITIYGALIVPVRIAFGIALEPGWILCDAVTDVLLWIDVGLHRAIASSDTADPVRQLKARSFYQPRTLRLQLLSSLPLDLLGRLLVPDPSARLLNVLRLPRLLRLPVVFAAFERWELTIDINPTVIRLYKLAIVMCLINHWVACLWFMVSSGDGSWLDQLNLAAASPLEHYFYSLYWAITTLTTVGYGDITPVTLPEILFTAVVMVLGVSLYAYVIGNVASLISSLDSAQARFQDQLAKVRSYLKEHHIPPSIQVKVIDYYYYRWETRRDLGDLSALQNIPRSLYAQIILHLHKEALEKVPLFKEASYELIEQMVLALKSEIYPPHEYVVREGQRGRAMYFILKGRVQILSERTGEAFETLGPGQFFGEIALLYSTIRTASVKTLSYCELFKLDQDHFDDVLHNNPEFALKMKAIAAERYQKV